MHDEDIDFTVYVTIGNSDDKLTQKRWAQFIAQVGAVVEDYRKGSASVFGPWFSAPDSARQSVCWCVEVAPASWWNLRQELEGLRRDFGQEAISFAVAKVEMIGG